MLSAALQLSRRVCRGSLLLGELSSAWHLGTCARVCVCPSPDCVPWRQAAGCRVSLLPPQISGDVTLTWRQHQQGKAVESVLGQELDVLNSARFPLTSSVP